MREGPLYPTDEGVAIAVRVSTGSTRPGIDGLHGDELRVRVRSRPEKGRANAEVAGLLEARLGAAAKLIRGMTSRSKVFVVADIDLKSVRQKLDI